MNFLEARQAALEGKKVRMVSNKTIYTASSFAVFPFDSFEIYGKWEIVEELKTTTKYLNVYPTHYGNWDIHNSAEDANYHAHSNALLGTIEITVDENGKFIKGENV